MTILDELAEHARERVEEAKKRVAFVEIRALAEAMPKGNFEFEKALKKDDISFICECKKASPSKGLIAPDFPYLQIAKEYEAAGADCISVLTEPKWFLGSNEYLREIAGNVQVPCLRKDFTVDPYMIYEAKVLGASAVLLICSILDEKTIREYIEICDSLGLSALVEAHNEAEVGSALKAGARIIGVNNRNLKDFTVDTENSRRLRELIPRDILFVSESGVKSASDVQKLREIGADAVLIGETLMRADDKKAKMQSLKGTRLKFCGLSRPADIEAVNEIKPEYIGFVFAEKSKRHVTHEKAAELKSLLSKDIKAVGVFVDAPLETVADLLKEGIIDVAQLHGHEDEEYIKALKKTSGKPVIKAFRVKTHEDAEAAERSSADMILLDSGAGTGTTFDWSVLKNVKRPYFLAGGLEPGNAGSAVAQLHPYGLDVSSGIETDGVKDRKKMEAFAKEARAEGNNKEAQND
ncbi:MAG: bifunctional indole-3-glycerol-phosphate synthase TrpC/phosphoribosylanthranilate isomerase TrpF [Lachnospiraceae bacterium]|nr:bifunctional indole-3-glycerol-phosphate synthase TrpC/phosphoribosylanthranilate isomerase TrpF [Lachnospiraceae bacterium]